MDISEGRGSRISSRLDMGYRGKTEVTATGNTKFLVSEIEKLKEKLFLPLSLLLLLFLLRWVCRGGEMGVRNLFFLISS